MPFDLASAKPIQGGAFDLSSATPGEQEPTGPAQPPQQALDKEARLAAAPPPKPVGMMDRFMGIPDALTTMARSAVAGPIGGMAGFGKSLTSGQFGTPAGVESGRKTASDVSARITGQPATQTGRSITSGIGSAFDASKLGGLNPAQGMAMSSLPRPPRGAMGRAIADTPEGFAAGQGLKKAGSAMTPTIEPQLADLARKADAMGLKITPDMLSDNRILRILGQASRDVPLSGSPAKHNQEAFNRLFIKAWGGDEKSKKVTPAIYEKAGSTHGETIGTLSEKYPIPFTPDLQARVAKIASEASNYETSDVAKIINSYATDIVDLGRKNGQIDGTAFRKLRTKVTSQMRRTENGDLKHALSELDDEMLNTIQAQLSPEELPAFNQARTYYANWKTAEPIVARMALKGIGDVSPAALAQRVGATASGRSAAAKGLGGDLAEISAVGNRFMTEPGSSLTTERALAYGMLGNLGKLMKVGAMYVPANVYNRMGPLAARRMIPPPPE